jgi:hypothetical protein
MVTSTFSYAAGWSWRVTRTLVMAPVLSPSLHAPPESPRAISAQHNEVDAVE